MTVLVRLNLLGFESSKEREVGGVTYSSRLSNPSGLYAETLRVQLSEILFRIVAANFWLSMSSSNSFMSSTKSGSPNLVLCNQSAYTECHSV